MLLNAAAALDCQPTLIELLEQHPKLAAAWERGQFLRRLYSAANSLMAPSQIAKEVGLEHKQLQEILNTDRETRQLYSEGRFQYCIKVKKMIEKAAEAGKMHAITRVENLLRAEAESQGKAISAFDIEHVPIQVTANLLGITRMTLHQYHREKGLSRNSDNTYNLKVVIPWILKYNEAKLLAGRSSAYIDPLRHERSLEIRQRRLEQDGFLQDSREIVKGLLAREQAMLDAQKHHIETLSGELEGLNYQQRIEMLKEYFQQQRKDRIRLPSQISLPKGGKEKLEELLAMLEPKETTG